MELLKKDYINLLNYYKINYNKKMSLKKLKEKGERILSKKLCSCIKSFKNKSENTSIPICTNAIFKKKGLKFKKFTCKKKSKLISLKKTIKNPKYK